MRFHNIIAQAQSQSRTLARGLGGEKGLQDFFPHSLRNIVAIFNYKRHFRKVTKLSTFAITPILGPAFHGNIVQYEV